MSRASSWISRERANWQNRLRGAHSENELLHFLIEGRDGYVEILARSLRWRAWPTREAHRERVDPIARGDYPELSNDSIRKMLTNYLARLVERLQRDAHLALTFSVLADLCAATVTYPSGREVTLSGDIAGMSWGEIESTLMRQLVDGLRTEWEGTITSPWPPCPLHEGSHALEPDFSRKSREGLRFDAY